MGLRRWFRRRPSADEIREEIESHVTMRVESDLIDPAAAHRRFGNVGRTREDVRRVWVAAFQDTLAQDARYTLRSWRRSPGFALTAILVLALGLGSATALFSAVDRILFRSLPYPDADRLVSVGIPLVFPNLVEGNPILFDRDYVGQWPVPPEPLRSITTMTGGDDCVLAEEPPERVDCALVEYNILQVLGVQVATGRDFDADDGLRGAPAVALISHLLWTRRFGADPGIPGRPLPLDREEPVTVAGVLPADFELPQGGPAEILLPLRMRPANPDEQQLRPLTAVARLEPGVSPEQAQVQLGPQAQGMLETFPASENTGIRVVPLRDAQVGDAAAIAWLLMGVTTILLLIASVNVTNLMLARVASRDREYAIRSALGAPKGRLARLALTESLLLAIAAGGAGLALASVLLRAFVRIAPADIPKIGQAALDLRVVVVAAGLALLVGFAVGLWPAVSVLQTNPLQGTRATSAAPPRVRFALVSAQIALTLAMLGASALLVRSLVGQMQVGLGFEPGEVVTIPFILDAARYPTQAQQAAFFEQVLERVRQAPGVEAAALSGAPSPRGFTLLSPVSNFQVRGRPPSLEDEAVPGPMIRVRDVTPGYFETFRIPMDRGRAFLEADRRSAEPAVILSESLKRLLFGDRDALGQRIRFREDRPWRVIVGVAGDVRNQGLADDSQPELYVVRSIGADDFTGREEHLSVRTSAGVALTEAFLAQAVADVDPLVPVTIESVDQQVAGLTERPRFVASLTSAFSGVALFLAAAGLYGVASYLVTERTREIGVRLALGATPGRVSGQLAGEAARWILGGAALGLVLMWSTNRVFASQLFGISPSDGQSIVLAVAVLLFALLAALSGPMVRAARVDPMAALRDE
jgi:predicted permease